MELVIFIIAIIMISIFVYLGSLEIKNYFWIFAVIFTLNFFYAFFIFLSEESSDMKLFWFLLISIIPLIGHIIFLIFFNKNRVSFSNKEYGEIREKFIIEKQKFNLDKKQENKNLIDILSIVQKNVTNVDIDIYKTGMDTYNKLFDDLENAKKYIHIEMYIISPSHVYEIMKEILLRKVKEGVEVRIIADHFGIWKMSRTELSYLESNGIQVVIFNKIIFPWINGKSNNRFHRKFYLIDGEIIHTGGLNLSDEYASLSTKYGYWLDINIRMTGEIANDYSTLFLMDWFFATNEQLSPDKFNLAKKSQNLQNNIVLIEDGPNIKENNLQYFLNNWNNVTFKKLKIATPYFVPDKNYLEIIKKLLQRGVDVEIYIPGRPDKPFVLFVSKYYCEEIYKMGAKIYQTNDVFLHSKIATFDGEFAYIGTNNVDVRSFYINMEQTNFLTGEIVKEMDDIFEDYKKISKTFVPKKSNPFLSFIKKFLVKFSSVLL